MKIKAILLNNEVVSNSAEAQSLFAASRFGEKKGQKILYSPFEALFLVQHKKMEVSDYRDQKLSSEDLLKKFVRADKEFHTKYAVFKDLRENGHIVKTALKFGAEFRVYEKGKKIGKDHSKWICFPVSETKTTSWQNFVAKNRVAHSTKKNLLIAIVDHDGDISYFEIRWTRA